MVHEVEGSRPRGRPKKTWKEVVCEDCQARKLNKEDAMDRCKWRKVTKEARWSEWVWVGECFFWYWPTRVVPDQRPLNRRCCCCRNLFIINRPLNTGMGWAVKKLQTSETTAGVLRIYHHTIVTLQSLQHDFYWTKMHPELNNR